MNLHEKILDYCFENQNNYCKLKLNNETIDCSDIPSEGLQEQLDTLFENLISRISSGKEICYDAYANCLMDVYHVTQLCPKPVHVFEYALTLLDLESKFPLSLTSLSLIRCLILLMAYENLIEPEYWYHLYNNGPSQLKHVFACGIFTSSGFDEDFYHQVCKEVNYVDLFAILRESKVIPDQISLGDFTMVNASVPEDVQVKIMQDVQFGQKSKTIVYN